MWHRHLRTVKRGRPNLRKHQLLLLQRQFNLKLLFLSGLAGKTTAKGLFHPLHSGLRLLQRCLALT